MNKENNTIDKQNNKDFLLFLLKMLEDPTPNNIIFIRKMLKVKIENLCVLCEEVTAETKFRFNGEHSVDLCKECFYRVAKEELNKTKTK